MAGRRALRQHDVHRLSDERADRSVGRLLQHDDDQCDNPLLSAATAGEKRKSVAERWSDPDLVTPGNQGLHAFYVGRRNVEGGGRQDHRELWSYRTVAGIRGSAWEGWDYDVYAQRSKTTLQQVYRNDFSVTRLVRALDVVDADGDITAGTTVPVCRSVLNGTDPNCVPYNILTLAGKVGGSSGTIPGGVTAAALAYLQVPLLQQANEVQTLVNASVTGDLGPWGFKSPWADDTVKMAFGFEARRDEVHDTVDNNFATGDGAGQGGPTVATEGATDLWELFTELQLPLVQNVWLAKQISVDAGYRYSDYDNHLHTHSYKVGADWAPTDDVRFRASYQRAVRAPNVLELFAPQAIGLFNAAADPCSATSVGAPAILTANCAATGAALVPGGNPLLNSPAGQYNGLFGGNLALHEETGVTQTVGVVFTPTMVPGLIASIDWWNIASAASSAPWVASTF
ncbi:MAG: TonB-dependent receptor [Alphaproteobacteria bacterium]